MNHLTEQELIAYRERAPQNQTAGAAHLRECAECRAELERIEAMPVPDPGEDFERRVWEQLAPRLPEKRLRWWEGFFEPRRLAVVGAMAALILVAFLVGRVTKTNVPTREVADSG